MIQTLPRIFNRKLCNSSIRLILDKRLNRFSVSVTSAKETLHLTHQYCLRDCASPPFQTKVLYWNEAESSFQSCFTSRRNMSTYENDKTKEDASNKNSSVATIDTNQADEEADLKEVGSCSRLPQSLYCLCVYISLTYYPMPLIYRF